jgi:hypothetical protein
VFGVRRSEIDTYAKILQATCCLLYLPLALKLSLQGTHTIILWCLINSRCKFIEKYKENEVLVMKCGAKIITPITAEAIREVE